MSGQLHLNGTFDQLSWRTPLLYSSTTFALMARPPLRLISGARILSSHSSQPADQFSSFPAHAYTSGSIFYPSVFIHLQIPPHATPLYSHPCKTLGVSHLCRIPAAGNRAPQDRKLCRFRSLRTLYLSCASFSHPGPLFSIVCGLFCKNTRVGVI
jgi:hypothetical protein